MNFVPMDSVDLNSETLFWKVAPVVVFCSSIAFTWPFFEDWYHFIKKKIIRKKVLKVGLGNFFSKSDHSCVF